MNEEKKAYKFVYVIAYILLGFFYPIRALGRSNVPKGAALFCANHTHWIDPFFMAFALTRKRQLHIMAKAELFKNRFLAYIFKRIGVFSVNRGKSDIVAIKKALRYLNNDEKVGIFPEGTRTKSENSVHAKTGAIRLADKSGAPIVPVYIQRKKSVFKESLIVIGEPYYINPDKNKLAAEDYDVLAQEMMDKIAALRPEGLAV